MRACCAFFFLFGFVWVQLVIYTGLQGEISPLPNVTAVRAFEGARATEPFEMSFASAWAQWWELAAPRHSSCDGKLTCVLAEVGFEVDPSGPKPLYVLNAGGNLVPNKNELHPEPYVCDLQGFFVDFGAVSSTLNEGSFADVVEARGHSLREQVFGQGAFGLGGCGSVRSSRELSGRCASTDIIEHTSRVLRALDQRDDAVSCAVRDDRVTVFVVRPAVMNLWEAHFAIVETVVRLAALRLLQSNNSQIIFLPPDSANVGLPGGSYDLWRLLAGSVVAARDVRPRAIHCFKRAILLADFCCEAAQLCPASLGVPKTAQTQVSPGPRVTIANTLAALPCASVAGACAYTLARHHFRSRVEFDPTHRNVILVSRRTAQSRRILNEESLAQSVQHLLNIHVKVLDFATLPVRQQAAVVMASDGLVGVHGAGLTNMLFLPPWGTVVEVALREGWHDVHGPQGSPQMYAEMAEALGLGYVSWMYDKPLDEEMTLRLSAPVLSSLVARALHLR